MGIIAEPSAPDPCAASEHLYSFLCTHSLYAFRDAAVSGKQLGAEVPSATH
jgi:hypothetical protein